MSYFGNSVYPVAPVSSQNTVVTINSATTLGPGAATYGKDFVTPTGGYNITLPLLTAPMIGGKFTISNTSLNDVNVYPASGNQIYYVAGANAFIALQPGVTVTFENIGGTVWLAASQSPAVTTNPVQYDNSLRIATTAFALQNNNAPVGSMRNGKASLAAANSSLTFTADEIVLATALGSSSIRLGSFNKTINLATVGANGMDIGTAPVSDYVAVYAIYNPTTGVSALLGTNVGASVASMIYGGVNMPSGYTFSTLIAVWPTNASSQFIAASYRDRCLNRPPVAVVSGAPTVYTSVALGAAVPRSAVAISGTLHAITNTAPGGVILIASDALGSGAQQTGIGGTTGLGVNGAFSYLQLSTPITAYWNTVGMSTADFSISAYWV